MCGYHFSLFLSVLTHTHTHTQVHVVYPLRGFVLTGRLRAFAMMRVIQNNQTTTDSTDSPLQRLRRSIRSRSTSGVEATRIAEYITSAAEVVAGQVNLVSSKPSNHALTQAVLRSSIENLSVFSKLTLHKIAECVMSTPSSKEITLRTTRKWNRLASTLVGLLELCRLAESLRDKHTKDEIKGLKDLWRCTDAAMCCVAEDIVDTCFDNVIPNSLSESQSRIRDAFKKLSNKVNLRKLLLANGMIQDEEDARRLTQFLAAIACRVVLRFLLGVLKLRTRLRVKVWKKFKLKPSQIDAGGESDVDIEHLPFHSDNVDVNEFCDLMWCFGFRREYNDVKHEDPRDEILLRRVRESIRKDRDGEVPLHYKTMKRKLIEEFGENVFSRCKVKISQELSTSSSLSSLSNSSSSSSSSSTKKKHYHLKHRHSSLVAESGDEGIICPQCRRTFSSVEIVTKHFAECVKIDYHESNDRKNEWFSSKNNLKTWIETQSCYDKKYGVNVKDFVRTWKSNNNSSSSSIKEWPSLGYLSSHLRHQFVMLLFRTLEDVPIEKTASLWEEYMEPAMRDLRQIMYILTAHVDVLDLEPILRRRTGCHESVLEIVNELIELREDVSTTQKEELLKSIRPFCEYPLERISFETRVRRCLDVFTQSCNIRGVAKGGGLPSPSSLKKKSSNAVSSGFEVIMDDGLEGLLESVRGRKAQ